MKANEYVRDLLEKSDYPNDLRYESMEIGEYLFITWFFDDYYGSHYKSDGWLYFYEDGKQIEPKPVP